MVIFYSILSHGSGAALLRYTRHFKPQKKQERRTPKTLPSLNTLIIHEPLLQRKPCTKLRLRLRFTLRRT